MSRHHRRSAQGRIRRRLVVTFRATEEEAPAAGLTVRVAKLPMSSVARALESDETRGFMKAIVDAGTGRILGDLPYTALRDGIFSHPTVAEALNNLFTALDRER